MLIACSNMFAIRGRYALIRMALMADYDRL